MCTTIIESGIDVPTANTIIIDRADRFGLAQLHQLRGRVGRSHHQAYAYLVTPPQERDDARTRRSASRRIESLEDLGAGFVLATHDLEIRGAGELLGEGQSGQIQEIGFALYMELLERAVAALRAGKTPELERPLHHGPEIDLHVPALLPEDYLPDVHVRLVLYKRIAGASPTEAELDDLQAETHRSLRAAAGAGEEPVPHRTPAQRRGAASASSGSTSAPAGGSVTFAADDADRPGRADPAGAAQRPQRCASTARASCASAGQHDEPEQRFDAAGRLLDALGKCVPADSG